MLFKLFFFILLDSVCLGCEELSKSHTGENISDVLKVILTEYNFKFCQRNLY